MSPLRSLFYSSNNKFVNTMCIPSTPRPASIQHLQLPLQYKYSTVSVHVALGSSRYIGAVAGNLRGRTVECSATVSTSAVAGNLRGRTVECSATVSTSAVAGNLRGRTVECSAPVSTRVCCSLQFSCTLLEKCSKKERKRVYCSNSSC